MSIPKCPDHQNRRSKLRPISLLPVLSKVLEKVARDRISYWLESQGVITGSQYGFRKAHSSELGILSCIGQVEQETAAGRKVLCASLDISSAFDSVRSDMLITTAQNLNLPSYLLEWLKSFVTNRKANLLVNEDMIPTNIFGACPQGSPISPTLFIMYINELLKTQWLPGIKVQGFADDILVWSGESDWQTAESNLQSALRGIHNWCRAHGLSLNPQKCSVMKFDRKKHQTGECMINLEGSMIPEVNCFRYLGVLLDQTISWKPQIEASARKGLERVSMLRRVAGNLWGLTPDLLHKIIKRAIEPAVYYGCAAWSKSTHNLKPIEKMIRQAGLLATGCLRAASYPSIYMLSGLRPPHLEVTSKLMKCGRRLEAQNHLGNIAPSSSFRTILKTETRRLEREGLLTDPLLVTKLIPRGKPPYEPPPLKLGSESLMASEEDYKLYMYTHVTDDSSRSVWKIAGAGSHELGHLDITCNPITQADIELIVLAEMLSRLDRHLSLPSQLDGSPSQRIFIYSQSQETYSELTKLLNISSHARDIQLTFESLIQDGQYQIFWEKFSAKSDYL